MHKQSKYHTLFAGWMVPAVFLLIFLAGLFGCSGTYGRLAVNSDVKALFERNEVLPDHQYFYTESPAWPRVVMGLHKDYTLQSDFWHPVKATPERLKRWLDFQQDSKQYLMGQNGSDIFDKNSRKIGVWYALKNTRDWGVVKMIDDRTVNIILQKAPENPLIPRFRQP
ncbi:hypothetical protein ACFL2E_04555 [Thermodesulfobacteriota bacterium]